MEFPIKSTQWISSCVNQTPIFRGLNPHVSLCISIYHHVLVGGLEHFLSHIGNNHPTWSAWLIFFRWVGWNHQPVYHCIIIYQHNILSMVKWKPLQTAALRSPMLREALLPLAPSGVGLVGSRSWPKVGVVPHPLGMVKNRLFMVNIPNSCDDSGMVQLAWF